jgi:hypothetical protein
MCSAKHDSCVQGDMFLFTFPDCGREGEAPAEPDLPKTLDQCHSWCFLH